MLFGCLKKIFFFIVFIKLALQGGKEITVASADCVFEELNFSLCLDQWTPGPQKRSVKTMEEKMEVV